MAEADPDTSELADLKHMFRIPAFFKPTPDSDAGKSPTSPLDFGVFANFGGLFSPRSPSPRFGHRNKWVSDKVGLSVLTSTEGHSYSFTRDNIVLAPQIKLNVDYTTTPLLFDPCVKSNSLPKNYTAASFPDPVKIHPRPSDVIVDEHTSPRRSSSSPVDIISSQAYSRSLSGREMALSEDYTCIISHGPNPKTTHIFGDCILDCDPKELEGLGSKEEVESLPNLSVDSSSRLCQNSHIDSEVSADKETVEDHLEISPGSSYNEDLFPMAMPLNP